MDRIQTAIAKARAARNGQSTGLAPARQRRRDNAVPPDGAQPPVWQNVPMHTLDRDRLTARRITAFESGPSGMEFDQLRTRMLQRMKPGGWRRIAIVSPSAQNGKSTVSANLALSCARQAHQRAMLIELDLRRPGLSPMLDLPRGLDVTQVLSGEADLADHAVRLRENLIVAPALPMRTGAAEFLQDPGTAAALDALDETYAPTIMLFDMPPMGAGDDVIGFLNNVDCALIIAAAGVTSMAEIDECEREVAERTKVLGVVLNKCRYEPGSSEYGYYY